MWWSLLKQAATETGILDSLETVAQASLAEAPSSSSGRAQFAGVAAAAIGQISGIFERGALRETMPVVSTAGELQLPLLAARLSTLAYMADCDALNREVAALVPGARLLSYPSHEHCWFLARGKPVGSDRADALILVFRGTSSTHDLELDLLVAPETGPKAGLFHGGFLRAVRDDITLHTALEENARGSVPLYLFGHSLGGALAMTLLHANLLPAAHVGHVTCVALGSPKVSFGPPPQHPRPTRLLLLVNGQDAVPRLLGSPMPVLQAATQALIARGSSRPPSEALLELLAQFAHPESIEIVFLSGGRAQRVPADPASREAVLHLTDGLAPWSVKDHAVSTYVEALETALSTISPPAPALGSLPTGWQRAVSDDGHAYFYNERGETSWTRPHA